MNENRRDTYARMAMADAQMVVDARNAARLHRKAHPNYSAACYRTSAQRAALIRGYADTIIHSAMAEQVTP